MTARRLGVCARVLVVSAALTAVGAPSAAQAPPVFRISSVLNPDAPLRRAPAQLVITVESSTPLSGASLRVTSPPTFEISAVGATVSRDPSQSMILVIPLGSFTGRVSRSVTIGTTANTQKGQYRVLLDVIGPVTQGQSVVTLAHEAVAISAIPTQPISAYLIFGIMGLAVGYAIRLLIKALTAITPPPLVAVPPPSGQTSNVRGRVTAFVTKHYYLVDFAVTLALGLAAMIALIKDGNVPETGAAWYSALLVGLGLGALTNSELITRVK